MMYIERQKIMTKNYTVNKVTINKDDSINKKSFWKSANNIEVSQWPWQTPDMPSPPNVSAKVLYSPSHLYIKFEVEEHFSRAIHTENQTQVCEDSCVEFFVAPNEKGYFNFEVNCIGSIHLRHGKGRDDRVKIADEDLNKIEKYTSLPTGEAIDEPVSVPSYTVAYAIPFSIFKKYAEAKVPKSGMLWRANFYKCGDLTPEPCWGIWNSVVTDNPDFHRPEFFGNIIFE